MATIKNVRALEILDSRGNPTVETTITFSDGSIGRAAVPSGASTGAHEACELRDGGKRYLGAGVQKVVMNVNKTIAEKIVGSQIKDQRAIDELLIKLDGTKNKSKLGANAILSVSLAFARASSQSQKMHLTSYINSLLPSKKMCLPVPYSNVINGGKHAGTTLRFQEFMVAPYGAKSFSQATQITSEIYHSLKVKIALKFGKGATNVGDEGGFAPALSSAEEAFNLLEETIDSLGYQKETGLAIDAAASEFFEKGKYVAHKTFSAGELVDYYASLAKSYPIVSIEDPFHEDDFESFSALTKKIGSKVQIVGDDLLTTNVSRIKEAVKKKSCNALLLKVNQIGTLTESLDAAKLSYESGWNVMVSHRSGETEDALIADLAVGIGSGQIKLGAPCRGERSAKFNQLLRIENEFAPNMPYFRKQNE